MPYKKVVKNSADDFVGTPLAGGNPLENPVSKSSIPVQSPVGEVTNTMNGQDQRSFQQPYQSHPQPFNYTNQGPTENVAGILDLQPEGHGFLRPKYIPS